MHLRQHLILEALVIHGYTGIDAGSKVRYLLNRIRCTALKAVRTRIMSDEDLHQDFARCVTLFKDFVKQSAQVARAQLGIAAMTMTPGGGQAKAIGDGGPTIGPVGVPTAYHGLSAMVVTKKQHNFGSATEESVLPPKTNDKNCIGTMNFISVLPWRSLTLVHCKHSPFGGGGGMVWQYAKIRTLFL